MKSGGVGKRYKRFASSCRRMPARCTRKLRLTPMNRPKLTKCIRMRGKKSEPHLDPADPPRRRANKRRGHGPYANDRPPIVGTVGRDTGKVRLRMVEHRDAKTLCDQVAQFTKQDSHVYTHEWQAYTHVDRPHSTVCLADKEWA